MSDNPIVSDIVLTREEEAQLHRQYIAGDNEAGGVLVQAQSRWILALINKLNLHRHIETDDVFSEIMPDILSALKGYDPDTFGTRLSTYLYPVVRRNGMKAAIRLAEHTLTNDQFDPEQVIEPEDFQSAAQETMQQIRSIIQDAPSHSLTEECRLIADRMFKGISQDEISRELGWPPMRVSDALSKIKGLIARRAVELHIDVSRWISDERLENLARSGDDEVSLF